MRAVTIAAREVQEAMVPRLGYSVGEVAALLGIETDAAGMRLWRMAQRGELVLMGSNHMQRRYRLPWVVQPADKPSDLDIPTIAERVERPRPTRKGGRPQKLRAAPRMPHPTPAMMAAQRLALRIGARTVLPLGEW